MPISLSGSLVLTGSITTTGGITISGSILSASYSATSSFSNDFTVLGNLTVFGTQSVQYITSSQLNVSDNVITVNVASPGVRFGGLSVFDSGSLSSEATASLFWDSQNNHWIYQRESGSTYDGGMLISGPRNAAGLGNEQGTTSCMLLVGQGGDHLTSSMIYHDGARTCFYGNTTLACSNNFGSNLSLRQTLTGSLFITGGVALRGAFDIVGPSPAISVSSSGAGVIVELRNTVACAYLGIDNLGAYILPTARGTAIYDGSTTRYLYVTSSGVGIGTTTPCVSFHVVGTSDSLGRVAKFNNSFNCASIDIGHSTNGGVIGYANIGSSNLANVFYVSTGAGTIGSGIVMNNAGCVGIVTNNPLYALDVRGTIAAMNAGSDGTLGTVMIYGNSGFPATQNSRARASTSASGPANILQFETSNGTIGCYNNNQLVLRGNGNVGINTADPGSALSIAGITNGSTPVVDIRPTGAGSFLRGVRMLNNTMSAGSSLMYAVGIADNARNMGQFYFYYAGDASTDNRLSFGLHSVDDVMSITGNGYVGIGTTSPGRPLQINGSKLSEIVQINNTRNGGSGEYAFVTTLGSNDNNTSNYHYIAATGGADKYYLFGNGTYQTVSDCRLKKNISTVTDTYLDKVNALRIVNYNWKDQKEGHELELGMIAQEVETLIPSIVHEGREHEDGNVYKGIQISSLPYITIKAIQEQQCTICSQASMINTLKTCIGIA
jgi:hypothetical protein